eukprot:COSAG02_NODE_179_length_31090_cov_49.813785_36_plen_82_part_00
MKFRTDEIPRNFLLYRVPVGASYQVHLKTRTRTTGSTIAPYAGYERIHVLLSIVLVASTCTRYSTAVRTSVPGTIHRLVPY